MSDVPCAGDRICRLEDIGDPGSRGMTVNLAGQLQDIFIVRQGERVYGYLNRCPHTGAPLDWMPDRFLDLDEKHIQCAMHAALFRIEDGYCVSGPCAGASLTPLAAETRAGELFITLPKPATKPRPDPAG